MQAHYPVAFAREMGLTASEFVRCLPEAFEPLAVTWPTAQAAVITMASGSATIQWRPLEARVIALIALPRVHVSFDFAGVDEGERQRVMKRFDLVMLRGGG